MPLFFKQKKEPDSKKVWVQFKGPNLEKLYDALQKEAKGDHRTLPEMIRFILAQRYGAVE